MTIASAGTDVSVLPTISIVTPSLNQGAFIRQTIESVLDQDYPNLEYWIIDGGSTDETIAIIREYENHPYLHWLSEPDEGQSDAINKGLARCRGEIWSWLNSDDMLAQGALQHVAETWLALSEPSLIYGLGRMIDKEGTDLGYFPSHSSRMDLQKLLSLRVIFCQPSVFIPTETTKSIGGLDPSFHYALDLKLWLKLAGLLSFRYTPQVLSYARFHPAAKSVAQADRFGDDVGRLLREAVQEGGMTEAEARARLALYLGARVHFMAPENVDWHEAWRYIRQAVQVYPSIAPEAMLLIAKSTLLAAGGKRRWPFLRWMHAKLRQHISW